MTKQLADYDESLQLLPKSGIPTWLGPNDNILIVQVD